MCWKQASMNDSVVIPCTLQSSLYQDPIITNLQVYSQCIYLDYLETKKFKGKLVKVRVWTLRFIKRPRKQ